VVWERNALNLRKLSAHYVWCQHDSGLVAALGKQGVSLAKVLFPLPKSVDWHIADTPALRERIETIWDMGAGYRSLDSILVCGPCSGINRQGGLRLFSRLATMKQDRSVSSTAPLAAAVSSLILLLYILATLTVIQRR
jgi:hypothetical protein